MTVGSNTPDPGKPVAPGAKKHGRFSTNQKAGAAAGTLAVVVALYLKSRASSSASATATPSTTTPVSTATPLNSGWQGNSQHGDIGSIEAQIAALEGQFSSLSSMGAPPPPAPNPGGLNVPPPAPAPAPPSPVISPSPSVTPVGTSGELATVGGSTPGFVPGTSSTVGTPAAIAAGDAVYSDPSVANYATYSDQVNAAYAAQGESVPAYVLAQEASAAAGNYS